MNRFHIVCWCIALLVAGCQSKKVAKESSAPPPITFKDDPNNVQLITSDINLFWQMYDNEVPLVTELEVNEQYLHIGTPALALFYEEKVQSSDELTGLLNSRIDRRFYDEVRDNTLRIGAQKQKIIQALEQFQSLYPEAIFTDVIFVMGALNTGGVVLPDGQIVIAAEMFSKPENADISYLNSWLQSVVRAPDYLPVVIIHELVHLQQRQFALKQNMPVGGQTLLDRALMEGAADFIAHLLLDKFLNDQLLSYGNPVEEKLWNQFSKKMHSTDFSGWLYNGSSAAKKPADLGYYIGFKIAQHYYQHATDKKQAIRDIIRIKDGSQFLEQSGYAGSFN